MQQGLSIKEMATQMRVSEVTVRSHQRAIVKKLALKNKGELDEWVKRHRLA